MAFCDLDLRSNFEVDLSRSKYTWFDLSRCDKHDDITIIDVTFKMKTLFAKNYFAQNNLFDFGELYRLNG